MFIIYNVKKEDENKTINELLKTNYNFSARLWTKLIKGKHIYKNSKICNTKDICKTGDEIKVDLQESEDNTNIIPKKIDLSILYEDEWLLIVDKPSGIAIHPSILHFDTSLSNGIKYYFDSINLKKKIRPITRLDKDTSGIVVFAKCEYIQESLIKQMKNKTFQKKYYAICMGTFENKSGTISLPIARKPGSIIERQIDFENGQDSITHYKLIKNFSEFSLVECSLETGRTHQIRIHMKAINHTLLGDTLYGTKSDLINRQALHCHFIEFIHPITNEKIKIECKLPLDFLKILNTKKE